MNTLVQHILEQYGIHGGIVHTVQKGYRNRSYQISLSDSPPVNVIIYKAEAEILTKIRNAHAVSAFLAQHAMPVRTSIDSRIIRLKGTLYTTYAGVYNYLPGSTIVWERYTRKHIKLLGKTLSDMHAVLKDFDPSELAHTADVVSEYRSVVKRMERYFADPNVQRALAKKLHLRIDTTLFSTLAFTLTWADHLRRKQALHMDFVRGNILFDGSGETLRISGILDFEKAAYGHPLFDVARTLAFLIVDCKYTPEEKVRKYFLYSGYHKRGATPLRRVSLAYRGTNRDLLEELVTLFLVYDFYKFLRHNPYEFLEQNEHFVRTCDALCARGRILSV